MMHDSITVSAIIVLCLWLLLAGLLGLQRLIRGALPASIFDGRRGWLRAAFKRWANR